MTQIEPGTATTDIRRRTSWRGILSQGPDARVAAGPYGWICSTALLVLVLSVGLRITAAGVVVTPERLLGLALIVLFPAWFLARNRIRSSPCFIDYLYFAWLAWIAGVTLASLPFSVAVRGLAPLILAAVFYLAPRYVAFLAPRSLADPRVSIAATLIFGLGGIISFALSDPGPRRAAFTVLEPNLYGAIMAFFCLLAVRNFDRRRPWLSRGVLVLAHLGLLLGFSRGPWLGYALALIVYVVLAKPEFLSVRRLQRNTLTRVAAVIIGCAVFLYVLGPLTHVFDYISPSTAVVTSHGRLLDSQTVETRVTLWSLAWNDFTTKPVTGLGALSFDDYHLDVLPQVGGHSPRNVWISNILLGVLHDSGIVGMLLVLGFCVPLLVKGFRTAWPGSAWRRLYRGRSGHELGRGPDVTGQRKEAAALWLAVSLAFLIVSQTTSMVTLGILWLALGCLSYVVAPDRAPDPAPQSPRGAVRDPDLSRTP